MDELGDKAVEAVELVAQHFRDIRLSPCNFSAQTALITLLDLIAEDPASDIAQWATPSTKGSAWRDGGPGELLQESEHPVHVRFREAWNDFCSSETPVM